MTNLAEKYAKLVLETMPKPRLDKVKVRFEIKHPKCYLIPITQLAVIQSYQALKNAWLSPNLYGIEGLPVPNMGTTFDIDAVTEEVYKVLVA